ncbi:type I-G CRISPR-associated helicase/endonuclease Cas3g [Thioalkalivibrio sulfidiphilus]|uniref:type I-G CRISPR-associated helicase/endonuclease Cas3g n=1 Tax=Thioalkalivibrio sulfidiphilus TaxID=1033854 RepID=UPI003BB16106
MKYADFFNQAAGFEPFPYQARLAEAPWPDTLDVPTGLGKTAAVTLAWLYKRREQRDEATPRRLIWCLPMRVLVEQTCRNIEHWLQRLNLHGLPGEGKVSVHLLMGGEDDVRAATWAEHPEEDMILVGTQDMLLSRALMRGYGMSRYQWPMHFGLLHNDALWVFDEVQLMGPGLQTSAQLEALRRDLGCVRQSRSLWVSATLNPGWLGTVDMRPWMDKLARHALDAQECTMDAVRARREAVKHLECLPVSLEGDSKTFVQAYVTGLAERVIQAHVPGTTTLVVLNTVERAQGLARALKERTEDRDPLLVHARFRARERRLLEQALGTQVPPEGRIVVATQAVEAGVDMTSRTLFTELAPWSSMVQRFGRCNRYGEYNGDGGARIYWIDLDDAVSVPYDAEQLAPSRERLRALTSASPVDLPPTKETAPEAMVLRRKDLLQLFDTDPDLSGFDLDVSPYIRDVRETDVQVFWRTLNRDQKTASRLDDIPRPLSRELCRASLSQIKSYRDKRKAGRVWAWDAVMGTWQSVSDAIRPGMTLLLDAEAGGYDPVLGFDAAHKGGVEVIPVPADLPAPEAYSSDVRSLLRRAVPLDMHLRDVGQAAAELCGALELDEVLSRSVIRAARWHDVGKAHEAFQNMLRAAMQDPQARRAGLWAKSDGMARARPEYFVERDGLQEKRPHFRHELASMLAWLEHHPEEPESNLIAYLIAAHHGKVRMGLRAQQREQLPHDPDLLFARGVWEGDALPPVPIDEGESVPPTVLRLDLMRLGDGPQGPSWSARTQSLLSEHGPFRLAWLETLVRLADWRASRLEQAEGAEHTDDEPSQENGHG